MSIAVFDDVDPDFYDEVRRSVVGMGEGDTEVVGVRLVLIEDVTGLPAWRATLPRW